MPSMQLTAEDERVILDALDGYARHLKFRIDRNPADPQWEQDAKRTERLARHMRAWRAGLGPVIEDPDENIEDADVIDNERGVVDDGSVMGKFAPEPFT